MQAGAAGQHLTSPEPKSDVPTMTTTTTITTLTLDAPIAAVAEALRAAGTGVELHLASASPWRYTIALCAPPDMESSGVTILERPVTVAIAARAPNVCGYMLPALIAESSVLGETAHRRWGAPDGEHERKRAVRHDGRTLSAALRTALEELRAAAQDAIALADARAMAIAAEQARYAEALAR